MMKLIHPKPNEPHCDAFERMIKKIKFEPVNEQNLATLDDFTKMLALTYFEGTGIGLSLGNHRVHSKDGQHSIIFKTTDDYITHFDVFPSTGKFMFCIKNHTDCIHPDQASIYLLSKREPQNKYRCILYKDGSSIIEVEKPDGSKMQMGTIK